VWVCGCVDVWTCACEGEDHGGFAFMVDGLWVVGGRIDKELVVGVFMGMM
jgi:hypothetical protein